jgi:hypothetical protein
MSKQRTFLRDVIIPTLPELFPTEESREYAMKNPHIYNVEHLVEICLAKVGGYEFVDEEGYDFTDYSDSKTTSINEKTLVLTIGSVENKIGSLRICAYNPIADRIDFFYMTQSQLRATEVACWGKSSHKTRILARWNAGRDNYNSFEKFRVDSFETLAKKGTL